MTGLWSPMVELSMWVITENPTDFPGQFVAREWLLGNGVHAVTDNHHVAPTLDDVRDLLPPFLHRLARDPNDDPVIVESWI
ncbi:hypothetical protein [Sphingobium cupriresistens]|uniref:hypothetical protein n=1 Tax=Sphingobium cupriresistens TaxID=1132417 RepID=UPI003BAE0004